MKTVGIIAEYNPLHNGHVYQLSRAKELTGADYVIVVLSGDFTQRGAPAVLDKYLRTEMALLSGADLVIDLPVCFATGSAEFFASGAVSILDSLGVDYLCFGSESGNLTVLKQTAQILSDEPEAFKELLSKALQSGMSYPAARAAALAQYSAAPLSSPNDILGVEYLKAIYRLKSSLRAVTLKREGSGFLDETLCDGSFCSALAIRNALLSGKDTASLSPFVPKSTLTILEKASKEHAFLCEDDFSSLLFYRLLSLSAEGYTDFADVSSSLSDKISSSLFSYRSYKEFCESLKTKDITYTRLSRCLLHILLDIRENERIAPYARVLGFRKDALALFGALKNSSIPLISKPADAKNLLSASALALFKQDVFAAHLYEGVLAQKKGGTPQNEYRRQIIIK